MAIGRTTRTEEELDDAAVADLVRSFLRVQASDWHRRQLNAVLPQVFELVDQARANGDRPDVQALIRQVYLQRALPVTAGD